MSASPPPTPQQQPVPTGTTKPASRRLVAALCVVLGCLMIWNIFFSKPAAPAKIQERQDGRPATPTEGQIRAAQAEAAAETERERQRKEREEALRKAHEAAGTTPPAKAVANRTGGGGG